jgi:hypothetical protein
MLQSDRGTWKRELTKDVLTLDEVAVQCIGIEIPVWLTSRID